VGSLDPRKNFKGLIRAFLKANLNDLKLLIIGEKNKIFSSQEIEELKQNDRLVFAGYVPDEKLLDLYRGAEAFVFPSFFEGFGIPPLEAQSCMCPVLVSNVTSLPEVFGDSVLYCDPYDVDDIARKIRELVENRPLRERLIEKGLENAKRFSWEKSAQVIYRKILDLQKERPS